MVNGKKKQKKVERESPTRFEEGDAWVYTCVKRRSYFLVAFSVGKWTQETCGRMLELVSKRLERPTPTNRIEFYTDGNDDYVYKIPEYFDVDCVDYGQLVKIREGGRVVDKIKRTVYGNTVSREIETTDVENFNGILRERVGRLVRKTKCFSKKKRCFVNALHVFQFYWDFINEFKRGVSPAMIEGISDRLWSWDDFLTYHYAV
jgi:IS1 family transposase